MKIKTKLILICASLSVIPLLTAIGILGNVSTKSAADALENAAKNQLIGIRENKKAQIEDYFGTVRNQIQTFSNDRMIINAMREFKRSFASTAQGADIESLREQLVTYYSEQFGNEYKNQNAGKVIDTGKLAEQMDAESVSLQYHYIKANTHPMGEKHKLDAAGDNSEYSRIHKKYHPHVRDFLEKFEYYDIFLVDPDSGDIVYSVFKELDYTTSMINGPYANSGIAEAFKAANAATSADAVALIDFKPYTPSYEAAASFIASPVYDGNEKLGILIFQMPIGRINDIMTSNKKWREMGLGASGETYIVGPDYKVRSMSRFLIEDAKGFLQLMQQAGMPQDQVNEIGAKQSNIGIQEIKTIGTKEALNGKKAYQIFADYRNISVLSAYTPLEISGLNWALMSEIDEEEAFSEVIKLSSKIFVFSIGIVVVIAIIAVIAGLFFAMTITKPVIRLSRVMEKVEEQNDLTLRSDVSSKDEIGTMANAFNNMLEKFEALIQQVTSSTTQLATAAEEVSAVANDSAKNVELQRSETEQVATSINEMTATVQEVAKNASSAAGAANSADNDAKSGKIVVEQTTQAIEKLAVEVENASNVIHGVEEDSKNIGTILDVIKDIAEQTNLLALNAAIEAARAGEQGRGFAVVADEVRTLASRTQESTTEIEAMIEKLQNGSRSAVEVMEQGRSQAQSGVEQAAEAGQSLEAITRAVSTISEMNTQIASAAEQQTAVAEEINKSISNIANVSEQTASGAEQTTATSNELSRLATQLQTLVNQFKINTGT